MEKIQSSKSDERQNARTYRGENESEVSDKPNVKWEDVAGLDAAKEALQEAVRTTTEAANEI